MDLFDLQREKSLKNTAPLAERMKPKRLEDYIGQEHILSPGKLLWRAINADRLTSLILYGPPGTGKTSLARIIAAKTKSNFVQLNAVTCGVKELREVVEEAKNLLGMYNKKTILFLDEIHRFNKAQQDGLLPHVENGTLVLIGATTENPYFEVNGALISRSMVFELKPLLPEHIGRITDRALEDQQSGYGSMKVELKKDAREFLCFTASGDARVALNALELAVLTTNKNAEGVTVITRETIEECVQKKALQYDKSGDNHYDTASAFIKSMRGSDPDAAVHYLARMIYAGEDPRFIARRIVIAASEDVGNADPMALMVANNAAQAVEYIGFPEARIILSQAATYVACAPKSNSCYLAIDKALDDVKSKDVGGVPEHLRDRHYSGAAKLSHGDGYLYPHNYENHYVKQQYLPDQLKGSKYYEPGDSGYEVRIRERFKRIKGI